MEKSHFNLRPLGWPKNGYPAHHQEYYCGIGAGVAFGRAVSEAHYKACMYAGVKIFGVNMETAPGQLEFQIGPCEGIAIGDHLHMARYILVRISEDFGVHASFAPKLVVGWAGAGGHINFSTKTMREGTEGWKLFDWIMERLEERHELHMDVYGDGNKERMSGKHETADWNEFSYAVGNRSASIRIPTEVASAGGKGYLEDRRPGSNIDPYVTCSLMLETCILQYEEGKELSNPLLKHFFDWRKWRDSNKLMSLI